MITHESFNINSSVLQSLMHRKHVYYGPSVVV